MLQLLVGSGVIIACGPRAVDHRRPPPPRPPPPRLPPPLNPPPPEREYDPRELARCVLLPELRLPLNALLLRLVDEGRCTAEGLRVAPLDEPRRSPVRGCVPTLGARVDPGERSAVDGRVVAPGA